MKKVILILGTIILIAGCAPNTIGVFGNNENSVSVNTNWSDRSKGPNYGPTLNVANQWCGQFNKTAKYIRKTIDGFMYSCN